MDRQNREGRTGKAEMDRQKRIEELDSRTRQAVQDRQKHDRQKQYRQNRIARRVAGQDCQDRAASA